MSRGERPSPHELGFAAGVLLFAVYQSDEQLRASGFAVADRQDLSRVHALFAALAGTTLDTNRAPERLPGHEALQLAADYLAANAETCELTENVRVWLRNGARL